MNTLIRVSIVLFFLYSCKKTSLEEVKHLTKEKNTPIEVAHDIEFVFSDSAKIKARITAPLMETYQNNDYYSILPKGLEITFYNALMQPNAYCFANYGIRRIREKLITLRDSVVVVNLKGDTLKTEELIWDERTDKVYSNKFVRVRTKDEIIKSEGFESDPTFSFYKFYKIRGTISLDQ